MNERKGNIVKLTLDPDNLPPLTAHERAQLDLTDVRTGFVGKPRVGGGRWYRYTMADLSHIGIRCAGRGGFAPRPPCVGHDGKSWLADPDELL